MKTSASLWRTIVLFYLLVFAGWQTLFVLHIAPDYVLPSPLQVFERLRQLFSDGLLLPSLQATLTRMVLGYAMATGCALLVGFGMGVSDTLNAGLKSLFLGLLTLPTAAWAPIALMIYGLDDRAIYFVIFMSSMPAVAIATADGIRGIPSIYIWAAQTLGTPRWAMPLRVVLPAALPNILTGVKLGWILGWHGAVSAELIKSSIGLGYLLQMGRELSDAPQVIGIMFATIVIGLALDHLVFGLIEKRVRTKRGLL